MTYLASGAGFARSRIVRNGTPVHVLSSVDHPVTQCMSAVTSTGPSAFSSSYVSVKVFSTSPETSKSHSAGSKAGIGP